MGVSERRWTIYKKAGVWDDVIEGPDTDEEGVGDGGIEVVEVRPSTGREAVAAEHWTVDVQRFKEAVWAVERENFRPGDALSALERAKV